MTLNQIIIKRTIKQKMAWDKLTDRETTEILYGGGAGGGKSWLGCFWIIISCQKYAGTRYLVGRTVLRSLKESTLLTFFEVCKQLGFKAEIDYIYSPGANLIKWQNGSEVYLKDLALNPSDPQFDDLGSTEYTYAFVDEASQISEKVKNVINSRLRFKHDVYKIIPKVLFCTNPAKNFLYYDFYIPHKEGKLLPYRSYVGALVQDNPFISSTYIEQLKKLDKVTKERLLFGNWEYDDDPAKLMEYDKIVDLFSNKVDALERKYITADIARFGDDETVIYLWSGLVVDKVITLRKASTRDTRLKLEELEREYKVQRSNILVDEDGIGGGVKDEMGGIKGFVNNSAAIQKMSSTDLLNYTNLKSQCYFKLADYVNDGKIAVRGINEEQKKKLIEDLEQVKRKDADKDGKLAVIGKDKVKEIIGRSPDYGDALMMRMYFELRQFVEPQVYGARIFR